MNEELIMNEEVTEVIDNNAVDDIGDSDYYSAAADEGDSTNWIATILKLVALGGIGIAILKKLWNSKIKGWFEARRAEKLAKKEAEELEKLRRMLIKIGVIDAEEVEAEVLDAEGSFDDDEN